MDFNIVLFKPEHARFNILNSYLEVIDTLLWGFKDLGLDCTFRLNEVDHTRMNIIFGWIPAFMGGLVDQFPKGSILYNLEQSKGSMRGLLAMELAAEHFRIWDYAPGNVERWQELNPTFPVYYAKISYAPSLLRPKAPDEDIDISYVGSLSLKRAEKLIACGSTVHHNSLVTLSNFWGKQRDEFIARSKVMLNVSSENPELPIFEIVRVSFYIANKKAVVCEMLPHLEIEDDMRETLRFVPTRHLGQACDELIHDPDLRRRYAQRCFDVFSERDVRDVIRGFFD